MGKLKTPIIFQTVVIVTFEDLRCIHTRRVCCHFCCIIMLVCVIAGFNYDSNSRFRMRANLLYLKLVTALVT